LARRYGREEEGGWMSMRTRPSRYDHQFSSATDQLLPDCDHPAFGNFHQPSPCFFGARNPALSVARLNDQPHVCIRTSGPPGLRAPTASTHPLAPALESVNQGGCNSRETGINSGDCTPHARRGSALSNWKIPEDDAAKGLGSLPAGFLATSSVTFNPMGSQRLDL